MKKRRNKIKINMENYHFIQCKDCKKKMIDIGYKKCKYCRNKLNRSNILRLYNIWRNILSQTSKYKSPSSWFLKKTCKLFEPWEKYQTFKSWALQHGYQDNLVLSRYDINEDYTPHNCYFIEPVENIPITQQRILNKDYIGISHRNNAYITQIQLNKHKIHIGTYNSKEEAAIAYDMYIEEFGLGRLQNYL